MHRCTLGNGSHFNTHKLDCRLHVLALCVGWTPLLGRLQPLKHPYLYAPEDTGHPARLMITSSVYFIWTLCCMRSPEGDLFLSVRVSEANSNGSLLTRERREPRFQYTLSHTHTHSHTLTHIQHHPCMHLSSVTPLLWAYRYLISQDGGQKMQVKNTRLIILLDLFYAVLE